MQRTFEIEFKLEQVTPTLMDAFQKINIIHPNFTPGSYITRRVGNLKRLHLTIPMISSKSISFTLESVTETEIEAIRFYNLAASLGSCIFIHSLNYAGNLTITIVTDEKVGKFLSNAPTVDSDN